MRIIETKVYKYDELSDKAKEKARDAVESDLKDNARSFMDWIYKQLETEYEWRNSDGVVAKNIIANEYEFTADGVQS